jgi:hypothetical protein
MYRGVGLVVLAVGIVLILFALAGEALALAIVAVDALRSFVDSFAAHA